MKFGRLWFDGVVTDHDVSTDGELIWHVVFDDGDECDLNEVELTAVMLPLSPPPPPLTTSVGTAGAPLALPPPILPSPASFFTPQVEPDPPQTIAHRTRSSHQAAAALTTTQSPPTLAPSSPTSVLPFVERGGRYEGGLTPPIVDSPHAFSHGEKSPMLSSPSSPPPQPPLTHGGGRVPGNPTFPLTHHLVGRHVRMKFGARWYRGVVTDHDVSTDNEFIWHVEFDDGDECDLNLAELLPILLPETHLFPVNVMS